MPSYLTLPGGLPGSLLLRGRDGAPRRSPLGPVEAQFRCEVPRSAFTSPSWPALYGHGLLGSRSEVGAGNVKAMAAEHGFTSCATDWIGMARDDIPVVPAALADTTRPLVHDGNSQGGILGGALVAAAPDIRTAVLGVTGMNYGLLLNRSKDFAPFHQVLDASCPDRLRQQVVIQLLQLSWDRGGTNGYADHPGDRRVLVHIAFGDHQVANVAADVQARTIGARLAAPALAPGRSPDRVPHPDPRSSVDARRQKAAFLTTGVVVDVCGGAPCTAPPAA